MDQFYRDLEIILDEYCTEKAEANEPYREIVEEIIVVLIIIFNIIWHSYQSTSKLSFLFYMHSTDIFRVYSVIVHFRVMMI